MKTLNKNTKALGTPSKTKTQPARYINSGVVNAIVDLDIAGTRRQLVQGVSASGARYESANGLTSGRTLVWWSKGDGAMLIESDPGDKDGANDRIVNCDATAEAD